MYVDNKKVKFKRLSKIIYGICPGTTNDKQKKLLQMQLINTVEENKKISTKCQQAEAKRARELFNLVGCRSVEDLKLVIRTNLIRDNTVTNKSVQWATNIYGPDIGQLKAQTTRIQSEPFRGYKY